MYRRSLMIGVFLLPTLLAGGCSIIPVDGPSANVINDESKQEAPPFRLVEVTPQNVASLSQAAQSDVLRLPPIPDGGDPTLGPGDIVQVTVVETVGGGLFTGLTPPGGSDEGARVTTLPAVQVDTSGFVQFPFAGNVAAVGLTPSQLAARIASKLAEQSIQPQVLVSVIRNLHNKVTVWGAVKSGGSFDVTPAEETLLQVVAEAGGPSVQPTDAMVALTRGRRTWRFPLQALIDDPTRDTRVQRGDSINVYSEPRTYLIFGASSVSDYPLPAHPVTLAEALAQGGGLRDSRAASQHAFLFRYEPGPLFDRITDAPRSPRPQPVIYEINMRTGQGIFLAEDIELRDKDIVYIPNAQVVQWSKFLDLLRISTSPITTAAGDANAF